MGNITISEIMLQVNMAEIVYSRLPHGLVSQTGLGDSDYLEFGQVGPVARLTATGPVQAPDRATINVNMNGEMSSLNPGRTNDKIDPNSKDFVYINVVIK